ncbi:unnamed protein product [Tuber melanosporum]|uniref:(Perigord truffle) hypothetical protein n=1 Tax=Tuber melanosporum (strain Mel28) TaxID=656061 RepID=D5GEK5_TUBMM|nr:uncharacterized protein GSTUM_00006537001 [Tuber melanosporum]CAZ82948.1 unnamed protein product [Tuber melanosporum]
MPELVLCPHSSAISGLAYQGSYDNKATFTTTPLYYGGIMDFMRSLMGYSMLWLYPSTIPIIPRNLLRALSVCQHPRAHYFSSVPYVLEVCAEDAAVVDVLKDMDIVGVDGAPLEKGIGDFLVENGVKLVSRFETSGCGFLMSSYRSFQTDMGWEYLRVRRDAGYEFISPRTSSFDSDGRFELEVLSDWPQMNCRPNTPRGGYATGDLFVPHPRILDAYKHVGRIDSLITLSNGKKLDPTVIERALGESELALDSFVFGDGRPFPGILVFPGPARNVPREDVFKLLSEENVVAKIVPDMIVFPLPHLYPLRNSAWQIMRQTTLEIFEEDIRRAYREYELGGLLGQRLRRDDVKKLEEFVRSVVVEAIGEKALARKPLESTADLFRYGIDSITAAHIRNQLLKGVEINVPMMSQYVVYEQASIAGAGRIAEYIFAGGEGVMGPEDREVTLMVQLVQKYDAVDTSWVFAKIMVESEARNEVVLLTGATGSLGRQVARQIVTERPEVTKLYCLCRKGSKAKMEALISELHRISSYSRGLSISSVVANLDLDGIEPSTYDCLREVTIIIHAAWSVGLLAPLSSFERPDISSVQQLLRLARECKRKAHFVFCSSMASQGSRWYIPQLCSHSLGVAGGLGYFRSKWVAEEICKNAALAGQTVSIIRIGQLSGSTSNGAWSQDAGWPMVIGTLGEIGCLPDFELKLSWLPVDLAARGVLDIAVRGDRVDTIPHEPVFNLGNTNLSTSWSDVLVWLEKAGARFKRVTPTHWLEEIEKLEPGARSRKIYPLWKALVFASPQIYGYPPVLTFASSNWSGSIHLLPWMIPV